MMVLPMGGLILGVGSSLIIILRGHLFPSALEQLLLLKGLLLGMKELLLSQSLFPFLPFLSATISASEGIEFFRVGYVEGVGSALTA